MTTATLPPVSIMAMGSIVALRKRRADLGLSQADLAKTMRISGQALSQLEQTKTFPTLPTWFAWCRALDYDPRPQLVEAHDTTPEPEPAG